MSIEMNPGADDSGFSEWFENWRGVFANEIQARKVFEEAQKKGGDRNATT